MAPRGRQHLREDLARRMREGAALIERFATGVLRSPDTDKVHDFRVQVRRTLAAVWVGRRLSPGGSFRGVRRRLRRLLRLLGSVRMLDVAIRDAKRFKLPVAALVARRAVALERLLRKLQKRKDLHDRLARSASAVGEEGKFDLALAIAGRAGRLRSALANSEKGKAEMHRLRIEAKRARYLLEILGRPHEGLVELQRRLGRTHDMEVLRHLLGRHPRVDRMERKERKEAQEIMYDAVRSATRELMGAAREIWSEEE